LRSMFMSISRSFPVLVCAGIFAAAAVRAGDTSDGKATTATTEEQPEEYNNWIELGIGGVITSGDRAQFEQEHRLPGDQPYGGIQGLHYEQTFGKDTTLAVDGHAIWDTNDYDIQVQLSQPKLGYIKAGFTEFRSWYDGNGGFFPHNDVFFPPPFPEMHIDRGDAWVELGLRVPNWPEITVRYEHEFRDGQKDSTTWGDTTLTGLPVNPTRKIVPSFRDIDETRDIVSLEISKTIGNTDVLLGMRYEHNKDDDSLNMERNAGQVGVVPAGQRFVTQLQKDDVDLFSGHGITVTRFSDSLWFTAGYSYTTLTNDISGTRIFGKQFDAAFGEPVPTLGPFDDAFIDLAGTAQVKENLFNANLFWMPLENLVILTGFRYTHENLDTESTFLAEEPVPNTPPFTPTNPAGGFHYGPPELGFGGRMADYDRFAQRLELRYTGINNWLFYAEGEWEEEYGHVNENQNIDGDVPLDKDTNALGQKYTIGANWYPMMRLNLSAQYYHKIADYNNDLISSAHQRLLNQDWNTDDLNVRITFRPKIPACLGTLALVTRYDFVHTSIDGQWFVEGETLAELQTGEIKQHVITESLNWNPLARFYLQASFSYTLNQTDMPANNIDLVPNTSPTVVNFRNDYWTVTSSAGYIIDDKTDFYTDFSFYCANDYFKNPAVAVPYGLGATEYSASATITRQLTKQMRLLLRYGYYNYRDETSGGHNNYRAHSLYSGLQVRF
jgi:phosphate-selective porin